jgi:hypothetical protein
MEWAAIAGGAGFACCVGSDPGTEIGRVSGVEVAVLEAAEDVDVVHVSVSDGHRRSCQLLGGP